MSDEKPKKLKPSEKPHYVNNREFSQAVHDYVMSVNEAKETDSDKPPIPDYIAMCFLRIAEGLSYKSNFIRYTYREEMVMDAVENCLKAIYNYDIDKATRTERPNAFAYFTQISWFAFLRRIQKEKKQQEIKFKFIEKGGFEDFIAVHGHEFAEDGNMGFVEDIRSRIERVHESDRMLKEFEQKEKKEAKREPQDPEGLEMFFGGR